jgi:amino acid adenylation domain-containing protein/non-ribosomal peptide synthase protein (TIGR01720 family)
VHQETIEGYRLSPQQAHLWLLQQDGRSLPYEAYCAVLIEGQLRAALLQTALAQVIQRHEILRTTFHCLSAMTIPLQVVSESSLFSVREEKLDKVEGPAAVVEALLRVARQSPFDLERGPLVQAWLLALAPEEHLLLLRLPALCTDRVGLENLVRELSLSYEACLRGELLTSEVLQYADLAAWQNELLESAETEAGREYWRKQEWGDGLKSKLPFEPRAEAVGQEQSERCGFDPQSLTVEIKAELRKQLETLAAAEGSSIAVLLLACWQVLLWRLMGQSDVVIGTAYDGRKYEEIKDALGLFARYLPVRCSLERHNQFSQVLRGADNAVRELYKWQEYFAWEQLASASGGGSFSFFPFCFEFAEAPARHAAGEISFSILQLSACIDRFILKLACQCQDRSLTATFHYDAQRLPQAEIARLAEQWLTLLDSFSRARQAAIGELEITSPHEREYLLVALNQTRTDYPSSVPIHHLIEAQAARRPEATAVVVEQAQLSYDQLNRRANQLAHYLQRLGVGPESLVALSVERSVEMMVGLLGILKAGGAYVPLDPVLPSERLAGMLEEARPRVLLAQERLLDRLAVPEGTQVVCLDRDWEAISQESQENPESGVRPENLVYVLFTSGSTGRPKGVAVEHRQLYNYVQGVSRKLALPEGASYATVTTLASDLGNTAIFPALSTGGCLHVIVTERAADAEGLADYFTRHPVDCLKIVPSHLSALLVTGRAKQVLPRQRLVLGGEASSWELIAKIRALRPECEVINHYGPTETTVGVLTYPIADCGLRIAESAGSHNPQSTIRNLQSTVPLGRPLGNTEIYILDEQLRPVPRWVAGELYIGGTSVARGYLRAPELTAEKFVPNPFSREGGERLYRSGDRARYLGDGQVEFLGRVDHQVKIRGYRVELGEIEAALQRQAGVEQSVVVVREGSHGEKRLVGYVVVKGESEVTGNGLKRALAERLPDYMVPSVIMKLERMPLTANGKVDRRALPEADEAGEGARSEYLAPRSVIEEIVAGVWAEVLGVERVGINDSFFELGGHSLMATQLISRIRDACQVELPLRSMFDAPTVAGLSERIEAMIRSGEGRQVPPIERASRDGALQLSFAQQRLWFLDQWEPESPFYNIFAPVRLKGQLNGRALERTLSEIVRRHEILRTTFSAVEGRPIQVIAPAGSISLPMIDLSELPPPLREAEAQRVAAAEARRPFDLAKGPLLRSLLLRLDEDEQVALLTMHHIVSDGWSAGILIREVAALYAAFLQGQPSPLAELSVQYADFAEWQRKWLQGEVLEKQLSYWKRKLGGALPVLQLPTDRPRPVVQRFRGAHESLALSADLSAAIRAMSQREGVTLFMTLLAAFKTLLYRYSGQDDIIVGSPIANRNRSEIEELVGFFVNTLVLRTDLSGNPSFRKLLDRVREVALEASTHQDLPFEKLVDELRLERDLSRTPLFQVVFVLQNAPRQALELPGLTITPLQVEGETAKFDLILGITDAEQGLMVQVEYNTDLFNEDSITRMLGHYQTLLEGIVTNPDQCLSNLPLLTEAERHQLLERNKSRAIYPKDSCLHDLFEAQVERTPDAIAVACEGERLTYRELNARANQLAHHLRSLGVGPDVLVACSLERSLDLVIAILGILKAGGAYLPLDLAYPKERLAFMLEDSQTPVLLTQQSLLDRLPEHRARVICLEADWETIARESEQNPAGGTESANLAYVIYTSGSTGKPKGVQVEHANVVRLFTATQAWYQFDEADVWTLFHSYAFDFSVWELWGALLYGGRLVVVPYWVSRSPEAFYELLVEERVTVLNQTPSAFRQLIRAEETAVAAKGVAAGTLALRLIIFGGEALELQQLRPWFDRHGDERPQLVNMYGITETTVHVTYRPIRAVDLKGGKGSVIGEAIPDLQVYVLDSRLEPVPIGVPGEMYVGGAGVARAYLRRPELSAERFITDPFSEEPGTRLYKTGDLARYLADGDLEYLGRIDQQVKIRGFRIELGEIEAALIQHPALREAVVLTQEDKPGEKRLVAYLVVMPGSAPSISELRDFLKVKLPDYMVPAAYVMLDALPLTENGKLDRCALPAPDATRPNLEETYAAPRDAVEEVLAEIWAKVLGLERVGIHDNFFELGGDSILSIQIIAKANQSGLRLTPKQVFQYQTIAELAAVTDTAPAIHAEQGLVTGTVPLTPIQHWFFEQRLPNPHHWNQALLLEVRRALDPHLLEQAVEHLLVHHDALRLRFVPEEAGWQQAMVTPDRATPFSRIDLSELPEAERWFAIEAKAAELQASLNLTEGPLVRVALFDLGLQEPGRLLIVIHHLAIDGVSWRILLEDLQMAYQQLVGSEMISLSPKTTSFKRWAERLVEYAQSAAVMEERAYWLAEARTKIAPLPVDYPEGRAANAEASSRSVSVSLDVEETEALLHEVPEAYYTQINDVLLTALAQAFAEWTGRRALLLDLEGHGREAIFEDVDLSRTVGWFTSIFPVLLELGKTSDPGESLKSVKEQLRAIPNRGLGYGLLRYLSGDKEITAALQRLPQAEVSFNYLGQLDQALPADSPFRPARESGGQVHSLRGSRKHLLDVRGSIAGGQLHLVWTYSEKAHRRSTIEHLARSFVEALRSLIAHCQAPEAGGYTPSDFPLAQLDQEALDAAFEEVEFEGR